MLVSPYLFQNINFNVCIYFKGLKYVYIIIQSYCGYRNRDSEDRQTTVLRCKNEKRNTIPDGLIKQRKSF